jgi:hypothetical protein
MGQDTTAYNEVLKTVYEKGIIDALNQEQPILNLMNRETEGWTGKEVKFPVKVKRNFSAAASAEGSIIHDAGQQEYENFVIPVKYNHGRIRLTAAVMKASESSKGAFGRALGTEVDGLVEDLADYRGRVIWGDGTGTLALVNEADPDLNNTLIVDAPGGIAGATNGSRFLRVGMYIAFASSAGALRSTTKGRTITAVDADGTNVTVDMTGATDVANSDLIVIGQTATSGVDNIAKTTYGKEQMGLSGMVDTTTYVSTFHGIDRSTSPGDTLQSTVIGSVGALSADVIQRAIDTVAQRARGKTDCIACEHSVSRAYAIMMANDRRYSGGSLIDPDAGTKLAKSRYLSFGDIPIIPDKYAPYGEMFGLQKDTFTRWILTEGEWADETGDILRFVTDQDTYEGVYRIFDNFSCEKGNANWRLTGITANVVVVNLP